MTKSTKSKTLDKKLLINRELSSLEFNKRVMEEAYDSNNPLLERARFISIVSSNLDEFTMVRVAGVCDQILAGLEEVDESGFTPRQLMEAISQVMHQMVDDLYTCFDRSIRPALKREDLVLAQLKKSTQKQWDFIDTLFQKNIYPVLTPMVVDKSRPFPLLANRSLNIGLLLADDKGGSEPVFATIQVPGVLDRLVEIPGEGKRVFVYMEDILKEYMEQLFSGHRIESMGCYRITRNGGLGVDEEGAEDLLEAIQQSLKMRKWGEVIRLELEQGMDERLVRHLVEELEVPETGLFHIKGPLDLSFLNLLSVLKGYDHLRYAILRPQLIPAFDEEQEDYFKVIEKNSLLVHHPYQSFDPVVDLAVQAAQDPDVLAIKQVLYRVSGNSPIVRALAQAAENGKQVSVLVEIKARFDEERNIGWAKQLEQAGCHVIYGLSGLKTHGKILLIVRREETGIKRYLHLGTGNYNDVTARGYEDLGYFTCDPHLGADASALFNMLSGLSNLGPLYKMHIAPYGLRARFLYHIQKETKNAREGKKAHIIAKMNSLIDSEIIEWLYDASQAGVKIDLIVRGICCLRPGLKGVSENIQVRSIVGRFLEHSRIYYFHNDSDEMIYLSSADWMPRNLDRRVEVMFPIEEKSLRTRIMNLFQAYLKDTVKARLLLADGTYVRVDRRGKTLFNAQEYFISTGM